MDSSELNDNVCRICLDYDVKLDWNDEIFESYGMTYKDCYYKYVKLSESDSEDYPTELCEMCAGELKNAHMLFEKALESFNILRVALSAKDFETEYEEDIELSNSQPKIDYNIDTPDENESIEYNLDSSIDDKTLIEIEDQVYLSPVHDNERIEETENGKRNQNEFSISEDAECRYFTDIQNLESSSETSFHQEIIEEDHTDLTELSSIKNAISKRKTYKTLMEQRIADLSKLSATKNPDQKINIYKCSEDPLMEQSLSECCDTESLESSTTKRSKPREKLCQYCSRKVNGTNHLKAHEATHRKNRERNESCPKCGIKLFTKVALNEHMKIHKEDRQKNHKCEFCEKAFFHKGALNVHRRIHLGQMVKCQICSKEFYRQVDLNKHLLTHSANPLQKKVLKFKYTVQCQYCNKSIWTNKWKAHKAEHLNQPQMKCKICDKIFFSRGSCTKHLNKTHRIRDYDQYIYYYVDSYSRMSHLMIRQQESVQTQHESVPTQQESVQTLTK